MIKRLMNNIICVMLCAVLGFTATAARGMTNTKETETPTAITRTVELSTNAMDAQSILDEFEDAKLTKEGTTTYFEGYQSIDSSFFEEFDLVSEDSIAEPVGKIYYKTSCDEETQIVTLIAEIVDENGTETLIDKMEGLLLVDENGNFDVAFVCEGEILLLSEMQEKGLIDNCGLFSKIKNSVKKVLDTTAGKIGTIVTVATCAVVGVVCAVVPGGQLVTAVCVGVAVGAVGGAITAGLASLEDESIDWKDVLCYTGVGAVVGGATSAATYGITTGIKTIIENVKFNQLVKQASQNATADKTYIGKYSSTESWSYDKIAKANNSSYFHLQNYDELVDQYGQEAVEEINKEWLRQQYFSSNDILTNINPNISKNLTGGFGREIKWLEEFGGKIWEDLGNGLWKLIK